MKRNLQFGYTVLEILFVIVLLSVMITFSIVSLSQYRENQRDNLRAADIDAVRLAIEEYRVVCGEYPDALDLATDNGCPTGAEYDDFDSLGDFIYAIPTDPSDESDYPYVGVRPTAVATKCTDYHIGAYLERETSDLLDRDHDESASIHTCDAATDFNGVEDATTFIYDFTSTSE